MRGSANDAPIGSATPSAISWPRRSRSRPTRSFLPLALTAAEQGDPGLHDMLAVPRNLTTDQTAGLRLEADPDQTIIATYNALSSELTVFVAEMGASSGATSRCRPRNG
jgi:hypothetical protein